MKILEVFKVENLVSESGVKYHRCHFRPVDVDDKGVSTFSGREKGTTTFFDGEEPNEGDRFKGDIYHYETTPYTIGDREVNKVTVVAFADETPVDIANNLLERNNACVILNGKPTKKLKKKAIVKEEEEAED